MDIQKIQRKHVVVIVAGLLVVAFLVEFTLTLASHIRMQSYRAKMTERTYDVRDLNVYKRVKNTKEQHLAELQRRYTLEFARSELKAALENAAGIAGIPVNDVSIEWDRSGESEGYRTLSLNIRVTTVFPRVGAFISLIEGGQSGENAVFPFAAKIQQIHIAAVRQTGREVSARIQLIVYQRV